MVYFSCDGCNESLKKPRVAKHLSSCRRCRTLICLDCQKEFTAESYVMHNQCISEVEKYSGPGYVAPENTNKGQKKQMGWMDCVRCAVNSFMTETSNQKNKKNHQIMLQGLLRYDNIPRKKAKFINFIKSSFSQFRYNSTLIDEVWEIITKDQNNIGSNEVAEASHTSPGANPTVETCTDMKENDDEYVNQKIKKKAKKRHMEDDLGDAENISNNDPENTSSRSDEDNIRKKKKKSKRKYAEDYVEDDIQESHNENEVDSCETDSKTKKKKKKNKLDKEENGNQNDMIARKRLGSPNSNDDIDEGPASKRSKKDYAPNDFVRERLNDTIEPEQTPRKFVISDVIREILARKGESGISVKKLEKKVISAYHLSLRPGQVNKTPKILSKLKTILSKHFKVVNERVFLLNGE